MKKFVPILVASLLIAGLLSGCGSQYKDGTFDGKTAIDGEGYFGEAKVTISSGKITAVEWKELKEDGTVKDENYCKDEPEEAYNIAQLAVEGSLQYPKKLIDTQDIEKVDVISGATGSNAVFKEAVKDALAKAK